VLNLLTHYTILQNNKQTISPITSIPVPEHKVSKTSLIFH